MRLQQALWNDSPSQARPLLVGHEGMDMPGATLLVMRMSALYLQGPLWRVPYFEEWKELWDDCKPRLPIHPPGARSWLWGMVGTLHEAEKRFNPLQVPVANWLAFVGEIVEQEKKSLNLDRQGLLEYLVVQATDYCYNDVIHALLHRHHLHFSTLNAQDAMGLMDRVFYQGGIVTLPDQPLHPQVHRLLLDIAQACQNSCRVEILQWVQVQEKRADMTSFRADLEALCLSSAQNPGVAMNAARRL